MEVNDRRLIYGIIPGICLEKQKTRVKPRSTPSLRAEIRNRDLPE
jgi:hypothetical protein